MPKKAKAPTGRKVGKKVVRQKKSPTLWRVRIFFLVGILLLSISGAYYTQQLLQLSFFHGAIPQAAIHLTSKPIEIRIPTVQIDLPVSETIIANNIWQIADNGASHLAISARPGENGTDIIYAHNTNDRFGPLLWLRIGDTITIRSADKKSYTYHITKITTVDPNKPNILTSQKGETLLLYTCTGFADLQRFVIIAKPST